MEPAPPAPPEPAAELLLAASVAGGVIFSFLISISPPVAKSRPSGCGCITDAVGASVGDVRGSDAGEGAFGPMGEGAFVVGGGGTGAGALDSDGLRVRNPRPRDMAPMLVLGGSGTGSAVMVDRLASCGLVLDDSSGTSANLSDSSSPDGACWVLTCDGCGGGVCFDISEAKGPPRPIDFIF